MSDVQEIRSLLHSARGEKGKSVMDLLVQIFAQTIYDNPRDPLANFELVSQEVKENSFRYFIDSKKEKHGGNLEELIKYSAEAQTLIGRPKEENEEGVLVDVAPEPLAHIPDLLEERELLRWAGIDLGEEEALRLQNSLKKLMKDKGAKDIRLWGKISGTEKDYYIVEGNGEGAEEEIERPNDFEKRGEGINTFTYWVADGAFGAWTELPDINPAHIKAAREIRKLFTGRLDAPVISNPHFPGLEKELLRAQIARITHSTVLIQKGLFKTVEDSPAEIEAEEESVTLSTEQLKSLGNWVHQHPNILKCGRVSHMEPEPVDEEIDVEILKAQILEADPLEERLKPLEKDAPLAGFEAAWISRYLGDQQEYEMTFPVKGKVTYAVNLIKSLWWPGAVILQQNGKMIHFYMGDGLKSATRRYYPVTPPFIVEDPVDRQEEKDPYPEKQPEEPKAEGEDVNPGDEED
ncbi:unnamed protein product [Blepharisma stoltei]|uniref:Uncharacterized protein n=1 Tax=Blepharisma stoltei TaxID=1481888 RepID=A0AAU9INT6_9CILI|nr:unnamed protein product [Blepharisma stoltei]